MNFNEITNYIKLVKNKFIPKYEYLIEPNDPIESSDEIVEEIYKYFNANL